MALFKNTIYHVVMFLLRATQPEYFRRILIDGRPCDDPNEHLMVVANHPYGIEDAFLLAYAYERSFYFVATAMNFQTRRGDRIKKRRLRGWLLRQCHVLPIVRSRSEGHMSDNLASFDAAAQHIAEGQALGIFAEGDSRGNQWNLLKLKAGAAEIALRVAELLRQKDQTVSIQVAGLTYTNWAEPFKSTVTLKFAEPFTVQPVDPADRAAVRAARREITSRMTELMRQLTVQIPAEYSERSGKIARLYAADYPNDYERLKRVAEGVARLADQVGDQREEIERMLDEYFALAERLKIYPGEERRKRNAAGLLLAAVPAYLGFVIHWPILWCTRWLVPSETTMMHALGSKRVTTAILLMIGFYLALGAAALVIGIWWRGLWGIPLALAVVTVVGSCGLVASRSLRHVNLLVFRLLPFGGRFRRYVALGRLLHNRLEEYRRQDPTASDSMSGNTATSKPTDRVATPMIEAYLRRLWPRLAEAIKQWKRDNCGLLAAALAYYVGLAFFPLILILLAGTGLLMQSTDWGGDTQQQIFDAIEKNSSPVLVMQVKNVLAEIKSGAIVSGPVGIVTLVLASIAVFLHLETAFGRVWKEEPAGPRGIVGSILHVVTHRLKAFLMLVLVGALLAASFVAGIALSAIAGLDGLTWKIGRFAVLLCVNVLLCATVYKVHSSVKIRWSTALRGGLLSSVIWEIGRHLLAAFVIADKYNAYGVVGSFLAIMLWLYCAGAVLFLGLEYVCVLHRESTGD